MRQRFIGTKYCVYGTHLWRLTLQSAACCSFRLATPALSEVLQPSNTLQDLINIPELRCNPFAGRIVELFSGDGSGTLNFSQFLHMLAVFSSRARSETKTVWAFALWDFDGTCPPPASCMSIGRVR